jgi:hypothetical protein
MSEEIEDELMHIINPPLFLNTRTKFKILERIDQ